ncbi:MAG: CCA tRNA nucleotidyltransferase [Desulfuromonas sp.]|nr:MAG: CCA tRNA nucleotidyltransferase [Desulfuromonas sp.]
MNTDLASQAASSDQPLVLPRAEHHISRTRIDDNTLKVLYRLSRNGYRAYLVGGGVRDLLLGQRPKDFDVGTDATPQQIKKLFRNCFLVGRRFRLAHIRFGADHVVEVATFRRHPGPEELPEDPSEHAFFVQNQFGTPRQDAFRRDFTINALFYDIASFSIIDYVGGLADLTARRLRVIGNPLIRFTEDPVRMLRALEFAARLGFAIDEPAREGIYARAPLIAEAAPARLREEVLGLFRNGVGSQVLRRAQAMGLLAPLMAGYEGDDQTFTLLEQVDRLTKETGEADEALIIAALFVSRLWRRLDAAGQIPISEVLELSGLLIGPYCNHFRIAHGLRHQARELLVGSYRLSRGTGRKGERRFLHHPSTPKALQLFKLWLPIHGGDQQLAQQWQQAIELAQDNRQSAPKQEVNSPARRPRRRSSRPSRPRRATQRQPS